MPPLPRAKPCRMANTAPGRKGAELKIRSWVSSSCRDQASVPWHSLKHGPEALRGLARPLGSEPPGTQADSATSCCDHRHRQSGPHISSEGSKRACACHFLSGHPAPTQELSAGSAHLLTSFLLKCLCHLLCDLQPSSWTSPRLSFIICKMRMK